MILISLSPTHIEFSIPQSALLKRNFPHWDLQTIILKYPRVLTQKMQGLTWHHQVSTVVLGVRILLGVIILLGVR